MEVELVGSHGFTPCENGHLVHRIAKLSHVARPMVLDKLFGCFAREGFRGQTVALCSQAKKALREGNDILPVLSQRRERDRQHVETIEEVFAEQLSLDEIQQ